MDSKCLIESPALTGLSGAESALTHSVVYGDNPVTTLTFDERSVVVLLVNCNLYGFTGMQGNIAMAMGTCRKCGSSCEIIFRYTVCVDGVVRHAKKGRPFPIPLCNCSEKKVA